MLAKRRLTEAALFAKLEQKGYPEDEIRAAVERCKRERYVDDRLFAQFYVESALERRNVGNRRIMAELVRKGIDPEAARDAVNGDGRSERRRAEDAMEKMLRLDPDRSYASVARAMERLGFPTPLIYDPLRRHAARFGPLAGMAMEQIDSDDHHHREE